MLPRRVTRYLLLAVLALASAGHGSEGFWPLHGLPAAEIKNECGVELDEAWVTRATRAAVSLRFPTGGGSGAIVSATGLVVTNRHVVVGPLGEHSTPGSNLMKSGFLAAKPEDEKRCEGLVVRGLVAVQELQPALREALRMREGRERRQLQRQIERSHGEKTRQPCEVVELYGGSEYWMYLYKDYSDVRLVYAPDEGLGNFGGHADNFSFPRHEVDVAFLRLYENGVPAKTPDFFEWSAAGAQDGQAVFSVGHPGNNNREMPVAYLAYLRDVRFPAQAAAYEQQEASLSARLKTGGGKAAEIEAGLHQASNARKMFLDTCAILSRPRVLPGLEAREKEWRAKFAAKPEAARALGKAYEDCGAACAKLKTIGAAGELGEFRSLRLMGAVSALLSFAERAEGMQGEPLARMSGSIQDFFKKGVYGGTGLDVDGEEAEFAGQLGAIEKLLPADDPLRAMVLMGRPAAELARALYRDSKLSNAEGCCALVQQGAAAIRASRDPALEFARTVKSYHLQTGRSEYGALVQSCEASSDAVRRALYALDPKGRAPETNRTARVTFGRVQGLDAPGAWRTTFRSQIEKANANTNAQKGAGPYVLSPLLKPGAGAELDTPLNFVCTADGGPGCSGAPVLDREGKLVGVMFDGNSDRVATLYYYAPVESGARSIAVHSAGVLYALKLAGAGALLAELKGAR